MHIAHVVRQFHPGVGGIETYVESLAREQKRAGHEVTVVTLDRVFTKPDTPLPAQDRRDGVRIRRIPYRGSSRYPIAPSFLALLRGADVVHVHAVDFFCDAAAWTTFLHRKPLVLSTHGGFFHTGYARLLKRAYFQTVTRLSLRAYSAVLASSHADFARFSAIRKSAMSVVENGVDIRKFADAGSRTLRKHIVFIGRFSTNKRLDRLLDFMRALCARDPAWRLSVVGVPWDLTADAITAAAAERGVGDHVTLHVDAPNQAVLEILGAASFVASASEFEGFGLSVVECMSAGLWPILNDIPPFRRLHEESSLGLIGDFKEPAQLADQLVAALPALVSSYADRRAAAISFARRYDWPAVAARIESIYRRVVGLDSRLICGVPVAVSGREQAIETLDHAIERKRPMKVAFLNSHAANLAQAVPAFRDCLRRSLVLNDGVGVDLASRLLFKRSFPANLNGTDFTPAYLAGTVHAHRIFLLGARPEVVARAARRLQARFPRHRVVGFHHGYAPPEDDDAVVARIRAARASLLLVAMGNPRQEVWVDRHLQATGATLALCVGAFFDFAAGAVPRAPEWVRAARVEWLFRLAIEPGRLWCRYLVGNPAFLARVMRQKLRSERVLGDAGAGTGAERPSAGPLTAVVNLPPDGGRHAPAA